MTVLLTVELKYEPLELEYEPMMLRRATAFMLRCSMMMMDAMEYSPVSIVLSRGGGLPCLMPPMFGGFSGTKKGMLPAYGRALASQGGTRQRQRRRDRRRRAQ